MIEIAIHGARRGYRRYGDRLILLDKHTAWRAESRI
jgi:hypothetical protein